MVKEYVPPPLLDSQGPGVVGRVGLKVPLQVVAGAIRARVASMELARSVLMGNI